MQGILSCAVVITIDFFLIREETMLYYLAMDTKDVQEVSDWLRSRVGIFHDYVVLTNHITHLYNTSYATNNVPGNVLIDLMEKFPDVDFTYLPRLIK